MVTVLSVQSVRRRLLSQYTFHEFAQIGVGLEEGRTQLRPYLLCIVWLLEDHARKGEEEAKACLGIVERNISDEDLDEPQEACGGLEIQAVGA